MKIKKILANVVETASVKMAKTAQGSASIFGFHQPKEPDMSKIIKNK